MANRFDEILNVFRSRINYETEVGIKVIIFETSADDLSAIEFKKEEWNKDATSKNLKRKSILAYVLKKFKDEIEYKLSEGILHFFNHTDFPSDLIQKRFYFVEYHSRLENISKAIYTLIQGYISGSSNFHNDLGELLKSNKKLGKKMGPLNPNFPQNYEDFLKEFMHVCQVLFEHSNEKDFQDMFGKIDDSILHLTYLIKIHEAVNNSATRLIEKCGQLLDFKAKIIFVDGFPTIKIEDEKLDTLFEIAKRAKEEELQKVREKIEKIVFNRLNDLNIPRLSSRRKPIEDDDFKRLLRYTNEFVLSKNIPSPIEPIKNVAASGVDVKYIFSQLYTDIDKANHKINIEEFVALLKVTFPELFSQYDSNTLIRKFRSTKPKRFLD